MAIAPLYYIWEKPEKFLTYFHPDMWSKFHSTIYSPCKSFPLSQTIGNQTGRKTALYYQL